MEAIAHEVAAALETDSAYVYLYDERTDELVLRATHGTSVADATKMPRMRRGEGITGAAAADRAPVMIAADAHLDPRFKAFPNLPEDDYASILAVPILAREKLEGALNVRTREPRAFTQAEVDLLMTIAARWRSRSSTRSCTPRRSGACTSSRRWRGSRRRSPSRSTWRSRSRRSCRRPWSRCTRRAPRSCSRTGGSPGRRAGPGRTRCGCRCAGAGARSASSSSTATRPSRDDDRQLLEAIASQAAVALEHGRMALRGVLAQEIHHRVKNNLQTVASLLRLQARAANVDPQKALGDSVNRILAIAAVHEVLTEHREDDVELDELIDRLRSMLVQGLVAGQEVELARSSRSGSRASGPPRSRSSSASCSGTPSSTAVARSRLR